MKVQLLYFEDCPNWRVAAERLRRVAAERGLRVEPVVVATIEAAQAWGFRGSPTVLLDGVDPFAEPHSPVGLACRLYPTPDGLAGSPTEKQLREVLAR